MTGRRFDALVLAGGTSRRLDGHDKAMVELGGSTLLERAVDAVREADRAIVVGPKRALDGRVLWCAEDPPGGGPVAAIAAGLGNVLRDVVVVLAVDHPFVGALLIRRLVDALTIEHDGIVVADAEGRPQLLVGAYRSDAVRLAIGTVDATHGGSVRSLLGPLTIATMVAADAAEDCDTWEDLASAGLRLETGRDAGVG